MNTSGINPTGHMVVIKMERAEGKVGSVYIPEKVVERESLASIKGVMVAVGPTAGDYADWPEGQAFLPVGSRVLLKKFAGSEVKGNDGHDYRICEDREVLAALEG